MMVIVEKAKKIQEKPKINNELMNKNKLMIDEIQNKESRLTALREMNNILEKKSNKVIEKLDKLMSSNNNN